MSLLLQFFLSPNPPAVEPLLDRLDRWADRLGRSVPTVVPRHCLEGRPPGSFGRAWDDFLRDRQIVPFETGPRRKQLHDGVHVLTGYDTDLAGEAEVQCFLLGATGRPLHAFLGLAILGRRRVAIAAGRQHQGQATAGESRAETLRDRRALRQRLRRAHQRGQRSTFDPDRWEPLPLLDLPLAIARQRAGVLPPAGERAGALGQG